MSLGANLTNRIAGKSDRPEYIPGTAGILQFILLFFMVPIVFFTNPFNRLWSLPGTGFIEAVLPPQGSALIVPIDGLGMSPSLRHPAMMLHPPFLYLGLIGFFIPYVFCIMALITKDTDTTWMRLCFPIALGAWLCLTIGMFLGSWWAYTILGWGGYWGWDAVEISGLIPWILSFGLIHSLRMAITKPVYSRWVYVLSILIVILIMFGILLTRSGLIDSVHAYSSGTMGPMLTILIIINLVAAVFLLVRRWRWLRDTGTRQQDGFLDQLIKVFNINLLLLAGIYLFGQTLPVTSRMFSIEPMSFTPSQFEYYSSPLLLSLVLITALHPIAHLWIVERKKFWKIFSTTAILAALVPITILFGWRLTLLGVVGFWACSLLLFIWFYAFWQDIILPVILKKRTTMHVGVRAASVLIHFGFAVMTLGILGAENLSSYAEIHIGVKDSIQVGRITIYSQAIREIQRHIGQTDYELDIEFEENGKRFALVPALEYFSKREMLHARPAIHSNIARDLQMVMTQLPERPDNKAVLKLYIFPLMSWIWVGGVLMAIGGLLQLTGFVKHQD